jgi:GR25 family glycosyltransferase involved in LPS biosynthesis
MNNIDKVFYINLERRKDRYEQINKELEIFPIEKVERFNAIEEGKIGCLKSHLEVLKRIGVQREGYSDLGKRFVNYNC